VADRFFALARRVRIIDFGDPRREALDLHPLRVQHRAANVVLRIEHAADHLLHEELKVDLESITLSGYDARPSRDQVLPRELEKVGVVPRQGPHDPRRQPDQSSDS
jgi:hypothetical protein